MYKLPDVVGAVLPNPPKFAPPNPVDADVVAVLKPPKAGADVAGAPKPWNCFNYLKYGILFPKMMKWKIISETKNQNDKKK